MLTYEKTQHRFANIDRITHLLFTSANGVKAFSQISDRRNLPAYCVGPATSAAAQQAGFSQIINADGDARDLIACVKTNVEVTGAHLCHIANEAAAGQVKQALQEAGYRVSFAPLYRMRAAKSLPEPALSALKGSVPLHILVHSAKGAEALKALLGEINLRPHMLIGISDKALKPLKARAFAARYIAARPNETELVAALQRAESRL